MPISFNKSNKRARVKPMVFALFLIPLLLGFLGTFLFIELEPFGLVIEDDLDPEVLGVSAPNVLSFQGRLTDLTDTPITSSSTVTFKLYNVASGGTALWTGSCSITPDQDGIFDVLLGSTCGTAIPDTLFSENDDTYLGITVGSDSEMSPRQKIAAAAYALNADTLQGFSPSQTPIANQVVVLDEAGNLDFGVTNPQITSSGDITISPVGNLIVSQGSVGIGTASPSQKLDLIGSMEFEYTTSSTTGVIYKGSSRFIHNFQHPSGGSAIPAGHNTFIGEGAGNFTMGSTATSTYHGSYNTGVGYQVLLSNTTGSNNVAVGDMALYFNTTGSSNVAIGNRALYDNTTGLSNMAMGRNALRFNTTGSENFAAGTNALYSNVSGDYNFAVGTNAGRYLADGITANETGNHSIFLGFNTSALGLGETNQIVIGNEAIGLGSNTVVLGNANIVTTALKGNVGIGTTSPSYSLDVAGDINTTTGTYRMAGIDYGQFFIDSAGTNGYLWSSDGTGRGTWVDPSTITTTDTNDYVDSISFNTTDGVLTLGRTGSLVDLTQDLDGRYLTSYTETDPVWVAAEPNYFHLGQNETVSGRPAFNGGVSGTSAPFTVDSNTVVTNLNADLLDGQDGTYYMDNTDSKVAVDASATPDYLGALATTGAIRIDSSGLTYTDGGNFITLGLEWDMNQHVTTDTNVTFASLNTGSGQMFLGDAAITNGDTNSIPTNDQVYDFVTGQGYSTGDNYVDSVAFNTGTGVLTLGRTGALGDLTQDLDGRFLLLSGGTMSGNISMANAHSITEIFSTQFYNTETTSHTAANGMLIYDQSDGLFLYDNYIGGARTASGWARVWDQNNDGSGSGLDADLLDGHNSSYFATASSAGVSSVSNSNGTLTISPTSGDVVASLNLGNANTWTASQTFNASTYFPGSGIWNSSGNLGVGTTSPGKELEVGTASKTSNTAIRVLSGDSYTSGFEAHGNSQGTGYLFVGQSASYGGGVFYNGDGTPAFATGETADRISFYRKSVGSNEVVFSYPHNSNTVTFRGDIAGTSKISFDAGANYSIDTNSSGLLFDGGDGSPDLLVYDESLYADQLKLGYGGTALLTTYDSGEDLQLTSNAGDVYINDNVGIGTSTPQTAFHLIGNQRIQYNTPEIQFMSPNGNNNYFIGANVSDVADGGFFIGTGYSMDYGGVSRITISSNGYVGIGTGSTGASQPLHVMGTARFQQVTPEVQLHSPNSSNAYYFGANISDTVDGGFVIGEGTSLNTGTHRLVIEGNGYVGIGTDSASYNLHVVGNGYFSSSVRAPIFYDSNNTGFYVNPASTSYVNIFKTERVWANATSPDNWMQINKYVASGNYVELSTSDGARGISTYASSIKYKKNVTDLEVDSSVIYDFRPVSFNWKGPSHSDDELKTIGLIAEEVEPLAPELIMYRDGDRNEILSVLYHLLPILNIKELQKHEAEINQIETRIENLENLYNSQEDTTDQIDVAQLLQINQTEEGDIEIMGGEIIFKGNGTLAIRKLKVEEDFTAGSGTILGNQNRVKIETQAVTEYSKIFITPTSETGNKQLYVTEIVEKESFYVNIDEPIEKDITFDWFLVDVEPKVP